MSRLFERAFDSEAVRRKISRPQMGAAILGTLKIYFLGQHSPGGKPWASLIRKIWTLI